MKIYLKEKIGNPDLFTGRKRELNHFLTWIDKSKREISKSTAILSRRKTGKSALLQRLYNITFHKNETVVPFYFEIRETNQWIGEFAKRFFLTFIFQYIAFKTGNKEYVELGDAGRFEDALAICGKEGLTRLELPIKNARTMFMEEDADGLWELAREMPKSVAGHTDERVVQMIDEFQFINRYIFRDKACTNRMKNLAGSYFHTVEYKNAPLLVSGSWVGWLMDDIITMLPGRFKFRRLRNMPEAESVEMIYRYSEIDRIPVSRETVFLMAGLCEGNPFYISALFRSDFPGKDLSTPEGVFATLEFESLHEDGEIRGMWLEYIDSALPRINEHNAKDMVVYLSKHRERFVPRRELKAKLNLNMTDQELDKKLLALLRCDIIEESRFQYRGVGDNIFDKIFRSRFADDIDSFVTEEGPREYRALFEKIMKRYKRLSGEYNRYKGAFAEFMIQQKLKHRAFREPEKFGSMMRGLPEDFEFARYKSVWPWHTPPLHKPEFQVDVFARAENRGDYSLIGEVKNRKAKFLLKEAEEFIIKAEVLMQIENVEKPALFVFSAGGFFKNTMKFLQEKNIAWSDDPGWLETDGLNRGEDE